MTDCKGIHAEEKKKVLDILDKWGLTPCLCDHDLNEMAEEIIEALIDNSGTY